ncbi:MAG: DUF2911 domain-containing protein [Bryobacterales bacterium]|nr:DUF2911 domain-containing protein [Bryobacterales bacterium]
MRLFRFALMAAVLLVVADTALAQRPASPRGEAAIQVGGEYEGRRYVGGKWITVDYGRPILRGRTGFFGEGASYGQAANAGAPVWRAGANKSTRFSTEADLKFGDETLPAGEYSMFVELKEGDWTLILSTHAAKDGFREPGEGLWGAYEYTPDKDVLRVSMNVSSMPVSYEQLTISFVNVTDKGGTLALMWENTVAMTSFTLP